MRTCAVYTHTFHVKTRTDIKTCTVQTHTHTTSHTLFHAYSDWQYSSPNPCRYHLQVHVPTLSSSSVCLKQEMRWKSTAEKQHSNNSVYSGQHSVCQNRPWQQNHCSKMVSTNPEVLVWKLIGPFFQCCVVWQDTHFFELWSIFSLGGIESVTFLNNKVITKHNVTVEYFKTTENPKFS